MWGLGSSKSRGYGEDDGYAGLKVSESAKIWFLGLVLVSNQGIKVPGKIKTHSNLFLFDTVQKPQLD